VTRIVFALYPAVTQLDFTGPHQVFSRLPNAQVECASLTGEAITTDNLTFSGLKKLADIEACDVLCVPGGYGTTDAIQNAEFLAQIRRLAASATYVTSVCTGSLILGAAGLLKGKRAACHWAWRDQLALFGAIPDPARVVRDGNVLSGGGVTAGIDFALTLAAEIAGPQAAQSIQLALEYAPSPPFESGRPETAPPEVLDFINGVFAKAMPERWAAAERAAAALG
jgi:cyclohexyl-isocyanide hydratase